MAIATRARSIGGIRKSSSISPLYAYDLLRPYHLSTCPLATSTCTASLAHSTRPLSIRACIPTPEFPIHSPIHTLPAVEMLLDSRIRCIAMLDVCRYSREWRGRAVWEHWTHLVWFLDLAILTTFFV
jgi:hypothetical protein